MRTRVACRPICAALGIAILAISSAANATVHRVFPGQSIQAAIDVAASGDTILVEPGTYKFSPPAPAEGQYYYGLRIKTHNLRLIGKVIPGKGDAGKVRLVYAGPPIDPANNVRAKDVGAGVYAAPDVSLPGDKTKRSCDPDVSDDSPLGQLCRKNKLKGFYIRGFTVEGFPRNGIQTRWVDGFAFVQNESIRNLNNGIYPTLSASGLVQSNVSYGSLDTAMWVAGSENVRVIGNEVFGSVIGFEITVSNNVWVTHNKIHDNTVGIGLFHPNGAGNPPLPVMKNWVIEFNDVRDNNRPNEAVAGTFQSALPPGIGILLAGVSDHVISKNLVKGNDFVGIAVLGWCTANDGGPNNCTANPPIADPAASNNQVTLNYVSGNGTNPPPIPISFLAADITYFEFEGSSGNCFEKNWPKGFTYVSSQPDGQLPTDGCYQCRPGKW
jgi:parallel beta-helix repeat protein